MASSLERKISNISNRSLLNKRYEYEFYLFFYIIIFKCDMFIKPQLSMCRRWRCNRNKLYKLIYLFINCEKLVLAMLRNNGKDVVVFCSHCKRFKSITTWSNQWIISFRIQVSNKKWRFPFRQDLKFNLKTLHLSISSCSTPGRWRWGVQCGIIKWPP